MCKKFPCRDDKCMLRHPRTCRYYSSFGKCKFGKSCAYLHLDSLVVLREQIKTLAQDIDQVKKENQNLLERCEQLFHEISMLKKVRIKEKFSRDKEVQASVSAPLLQVLPTKEVICKSCHCLIHTNEDTNSCMCHLQGANVTYVQI